MGLRFGVEIGQDRHLTLHWLRWACHDHVFGLYQLRPVGEFFWTLGFSLPFPVSPVCQVFPRKPGSSFPFRLSDHDEICKASHQAKQQAAPDHSGERGTGGVSEGNGPQVQARPPGSWAQTPIPGLDVGIRPPQIQCKHKSKEKHSSSSSHPSLQGRTRPSSLPVCTAARPPPCSAVWGRRAERQSALVVTVTGDPLIAGASA